MAPTLTTNIPTITEIIPTLGNDGVIVSFTNQFTSSAGYVIEYSQSPDVGPAFDSVSTDKLDGNVITGLSAGTKYYFRVGIANDNLYSEIVACATRPDKVVGVSASYVVDENGASTSATEMLVSFTPFTDTNTGVISYGVYRTTGDVIDTSPFAYGTSSPIRVTGLTPGVSYSFEVAAIVKDSKDRDQYSIAASDPSDPLVASLPLPNAPTLNDPPTDVTNNRVTLSWTYSKPADFAGADVKRYIIKYTIKDSNYIDSIYTENTDYTIAVIPDTYYEFTVAADNSAGIGPDSTTITVLSGPPDELFGPPQSLTLTSSMSDNTIRATWGLPSPLPGNINASSLIYKVYVSTTDGVFDSEPTDEILAPTTSYDIIVTDFNLTYYVKVVAYDIMNGRYSMEVTGSLIFAKPSKPVITNIVSDYNNTSSVFVNYEGSTSDNGMSHYELTYTKDLTFMNVASAQISITHTEYLTQPLGAYITISELSAGTKYYFRLTAVDELNMRTDSDVVAGSTNPDVPLSASVGFKKDSNGAIMSATEVVIAFTPPAENPDIVAYVIKELNYTKYEFNPIKRVEKIDLGINDDGSATISISDLLPGTKHQFSVNAVTKSSDNADQPGDPSFTDQITMPSPPAIIPTTTINNTSDSSTITFIFSEVSGATTYKLFNEDLVELNGVLITEENGQIMVSYSISGLKTTTTLSFYLMAYDSDIQISKRQTTPLTTIIPCLPRDTRVLTPGGYRLVQDINNGEFVTTDDGREVQVIVHRSGTTSSDAKSAPVKISARSFFGEYPVAPIRLSSWHAFKVGLGNQWLLPKDVIGVDGVIQEPFGQAVEYYHLELPNYLTDNLVIEGGAVVESYGIPWKMNNNVWGQTTYIMDNVAGYAIRSDFNEMKPIV